MRAPLDTAALIAEVPAHCTTKGMFFEQIARPARSCGVDCQARYVAFRDYPLRDYMRLIADYGAARHPGMPVREALRRVGWEAFPTLMSSVAGRVIFAFAGRDVRSALRLAPDAYKHSLSQLLGGLAPEHAAPSRARVPRRLQLCRCLPGRRDRGRLPRFRRRAPRTAARALVGPARHAGPLVTRDRAHARKRPACPGAPSLALTKQASVHARPSTAGVPPGSRQILIGAESAPRPTGRAATGRMRVNSLCARSPIVRRCG